MKPISSSRRMESCKEKYGSVMEPNVAGNISYDELGSEGAWVEISEWPAFTNWID